MIDHQTTVTRLIDELPAHLVTPEPRLIEMEAKRRADRRRAVQRIGVGIFIALLGGGIFVALATDSQQDSVSTSPAETVDVSMDDPTPNLPEESTGLTIEPKAVTSRDPIRIVAADTLLGLYFTLERWNGDNWDPTVHLLVAPYGIKTDTEVIPLGAKDIVRLHPGVSLPIELTLPEDSKPGRYRLCSSDSSESAPLYCGQFDLS